MSVGVRIKSLRTGQRMTLVTLGEKIGMTNGALSLIENGKANPSDRTLKLIAHEFGVNEEWLRTGEGEKYVKKSVEEEMQTAVEKLLSGEVPEMRLRLVKALAGLSDDQMWIVEAKLWEILTGEILTPEAMKERIQDLDEWKATAKTLKAAPSGANFYSIPQDMTDDEIRVELERQLADEKGHREGSSDSGPENFGVAAG